MTRRHDLHDSLAVFISCAHCGSPVNSQALYCTECGTALPKRTPDTVVLPLQRTAPETRSEPEPVRRSRVRRSLVALAGVGLVAGVAVLAVDDRGAHQQLTRTRGALHSTQATLHSTQAQLSQAQADLAGANADLTRTKASLSSVQATLKTKEQALAGVQNSLTDAKNSVTVQAGQIETLKSCLNGVRIALSDVAYGDYSGALSALDAVQVSCNAADSIL